jgi:membrane-bound lytic murein transglycosylase A
MPAPEPAPLTARAAGNAGFSPLAFSDLPGFAADDHTEAFAVFQRSCAAIAERRAPLREAIAPSPALAAIGRRALTLRSPGRLEALRFFEAHFRPFRAKPAQGAGPGGFFTGYYEPVVEGSLTRTDAFTAPILSPPIDLAERGAPARAAIEAGALAGRDHPIVWLRDPIEVFMIQVQGSARVRLADGRLLRLVYAGRNGWPYSSIGRILIESEAIKPEDMSLAALKAWIRAQGQAAGEAGAALMRRNESYVFFRLDSALDTDAGPIGGAGLSLAPLRSLAVDRNIHPYGTPVWIDADIPWHSSAATPFRRLMIAQDTGSAIIGPARADIFFGAGDAAGARAGDVRHAGEFVVFLPVEEGSLR